MGQITTTDIPRLDQPLLLEPSAVSLSLAIQSACDHLGRFAKFTRLHNSTLAVNAAEAWISSGLIARPHDNVVKNNGKQPAIVT
jgi:hypothetical protein